MGKSSPVLAGDKVFLTAHADDQRVVLALDRETGNILWRQALTAARTESRNDLNDAAAPTPVTDGENVYAFFSEIGLVSYGPDGKQRWKVPLGPFDTEHGMSTSPIFVDGKIVLLVDQIGDSYLAAFGASNGELLWKTERPSVMGGYSTPAVYAPERGASQIVAASPMELVGYSVETGERLWWVNGLGYQPKSVPVLADNVVYVNAGGFGGGSGAPFERVSQWLDKNKDGRIGLEEVEGNAGRFMSALVRRWAGKDAGVDAEEWKQAQQAIRGARAFWAVRLDGKGDITETHVGWRVSKALPAVPSPLLYEGVLYLFKDGGIVTALDPESGEVLKQGRIRDAIDKYYSSPVAADGKIYVASETGKLAVLLAGQNWEVLTVNDFDEDIYATPALADGRIYLRTSGALYCLREHELISAVRQGLITSVRAMLGRDSMTPQILAAALGEANSTGQTEIADLLRDSGGALPSSAEEEPLISTHRLEEYAGTYETNQGWKASVELEEGVLLLKRWGQESRLNPIDSTTFQVDERVPMTVTFELEGSHPVAFEQTRDGRTLVFKRVTQKN